MDGSGISAVMETPLLSGQPVPVCGHLQRKEVLSHITASGLSPPVVPMKGSLVPLFIFGAGWRGTECLVEETAWK